jgi:hypothetical protein
LRSFTPAKTVRINGLNGCFQPVIGPEQRLAPFGPFALGLTQLNCRAILAAKAAEIL